MTVTIPHGTCTTVCANVTSQKLSIPYTLEGRFSGAMSGGTAFRCCYLRPGGANSCAPGAGWQLDQNAGYAVQRMKASGGDCPGLSDASSGNAGVSLPGTFSWGSNWAWRSIKYSKPLRDKHHKPIPNPCKSCSSGARDDQN